MGKKKDKAPKLSKKELRKLAEKAERKAAKKAAAKKAEKKAEKHRAEATKGMKKAQVKSADHPTESAASESGVAESTVKEAKDERHPHLEHLDRVGELTAILNDDTAKKAAKKAAQAELDQLRADGEKLQEEKAARKAELSGTPEEIDAAIAARRAEKADSRKARIAEGKASTLPDEPGSPERLAAMAEKVATGESTKADPEPKPKKAAKKSEPKIVSEEGVQGEDLPAVAATEEEITFANPSEAPLTDFQTNGLNQYKVLRPSDQKMVGYTRVTTYIACLEDNSKLADWKMRILLEGVAAVEENGDPVTAKVRDLVHNRDMAILKARKRDRKGKLQTGELATFVNGAWSDFKRALDELASEVFEIGGGREAATKGTDIHALCDLHDSEGMDAVQDKLDAGEITPADFADVEAYAAAIKSLGLKVVASEMVVVNDELKVAGRLDRIVIGKLPELRDPKTNEVIRPRDARARRYVLDIKTGRIDYGAGKIAQQIRLYADSQAYDLNDHTRSSHGANRTTGLLLHLAAGSGQAEVHVVDLALGAVGNKLAGEVRAFRSQGRKAVDPRVDLLKIVAEETRESESESEAA